MICNLEVIGSSPLEGSKYLIMRAMKDKKKFGWNKKPKNHRCKVFGYSLPKEIRKEERKLLKLIKHKILMYIPLTLEEAKYK